MDFVVGGFQGPFHFKLEGLQILNSVLLRTSFIVCSFQLLHLRSLAQEVFIRMHPVHAHRPR